MGFLLIESLPKRILKLIGIRYRNTLDKVYMRTTNDTEAINASDEEFIE